MRRTPTILLLLCAMILTGCTRIPTSGPVQVVSQRNQGAEQRTDIQPLPPPAGAKPDVIVQGFLTAMADGRGNYDIARQYLTPAAAEHWRPREILVYSDDTAPHQIVDGTLHLAINVTGRVDERGTFTRTAEQRTFDLTLAKNVAGEWRIATPPQHLIISESLFQQAFSPITLYFLDQSGSVLIPDTFYVPAATISPEVIVSQLLRGPSAWTTPVVQQVIPDGLRLGDRGVSLTGEAIAVIDLSAEALQLDSQHLQLFLAQLTASLANSRWSSQQRATAVRLTVDGNVMTLPDQDVRGTVPIQIFQRYMSTMKQASREMFGLGKDDKLYHIRDLVNSSAAQRDPVAMVSPEQSWGTLAISVDASQIALVNAQRNRLYTALLATSPVEPAVALSAPHLLRPQFTRFEDLWTMSVSGGRTVVYRIAKGSATIIPSPALDGVVVDTFSISPDGVRMAVVGTRDGKPVVGEVQISRDPLIPGVRNWRPMQIETFGGSKTVLDIDWRSDTKLLALAQEGAGSQQVSIYELDESSVQLQQVLIPTWDPISLMTSPYGDLLAVGISKDGRVFRRFDDIHWRLYVEDMHMVAFPG